MRLSFEQSREAEEAILLNKVALAKVYARVFESKDGKIVLEDLARASGIYRTSFAEGSSNYSAFLEGHKALFFYICSQLENNNISNMEGRND